MTDTLTEMVLERRLPADAETVFAFVTRTENIAKWWGPEGMTCPVLDIDLTETGPWVTVMSGAEGKRYKVSGEVLAVDPPRRVEFTWGWHDENDRRGHESRVAFEVTPVAEGGAVFRLTHSDLPDEESARNHEGGWSSSLRKLERAFA